MNVLPLTAIAPADPDALALVGGKGLGLATLLAAGLPVPAGFCITTDAYRSVVDSVGLRPLIVEALAGPEPDAGVQALFGSVALGAELEDAVVAEYRRLAGASGHDVVVAVRSSATAEDLPTASFAGQQDTYLGIVGAEAVLDAVRRCWASVWNSHAVAYRARAQAVDAGPTTPNSPGAPDDVAIAVVVQRLVEADAAGVLFTADPVSGARDVMVVDATWGLGEALVGGLVTPDHAIIDKATGRLRTYAVGAKHLMTVRTPDGTELAETPADKRKRKVLDEAALASLRDIGATIEAHTGRPMDVEWVLSDAGIEVVQARPITALGPDLLGMEWSREMVIERYPDPVTPLTWSVVSSTFFSSLDAGVRALGGAMPRDVPMVRLIHGRVYVNATGFADGMASLPLHPPVEASAATPRPTPSGRARLAGLVGVVRLVLGTHRDWERRLPAYVAATRAGDETNWDALGADALLAQWRDRGGLLEPMLDNHARAIIAGDLTLQLLGAATKRWLGDADGSLVLTLLSGLEGNRTVETNHDLWRIAEQVRRRPALSARLSAHPDAVLADLDAVDGGREFAGMLQDFLTRYGHRSPRYEFRHPTWREDPSQVVGLLRLMLDGVPDPLAGQAAAASRRLAATRTARRKLGVRRVAFDVVLWLAQTYFRLRENQQFYLVMGTPGFRAMVARTGSLLVENGVLGDAADAYFLHSDELQEQLRGVAKGKPVDARALVAERRARLVADSRLDAPLRLGGTAVAAEATDSVLTGIAGSAGRATGRVRIVRGPEDFATVERGDIIVAPATTPAWTPLFGVASGLVTEHGGLLSHSGVVAREYGLPAVLGVPDALRRLADGDEVTVDGSAGVVTFEGSRREVGPNDLSSTSGC